MSAQRLASSKLTTISVMGILLTCVGPARADGPFSTYGVDATSKAMGGARTASADSWSAPFYNPAGLAQLDEGIFALQFQVSLPQIHLQLERELPASDPLAARLPVPKAGTQIGIAFPFGGFLKDWLYFGMAIYLPATVVTNATAYDPARPFTYLYDSYTDHYEAVPALTLKWTDWLATGVGVRIGAGQRGRVKLGIDPLRQRFTNQEMSAVQYSIYAPTVGATLGPFGNALVKVQAGVSYRHKLSTPMDVPAFIELDGLDATIVAPIAGSSNYSPSTWSGGLALRFFESWLMEADVNYQLWSQAPPPTLSVQAIVTGDDLDALGLSDAIDAPGPGQSRVVKPGFQNTLSVRLGTQVLLFDDLLKLSAGYAYRPTFVPDQVSGTNIVDATTHVVSAGFAVAIALPFLERPLWADVAWLSQIFQPRTATKERADDPVGDWHVSGAMHEVSAGLSYSF